MKEYIAFFTFSDNILFEILYRNSTFRKGLWATVTRFPHFFTFPLHFYPTPTPSVVAYDKRNFIIYSSIFSGFLL